MKPLLRRTLAALSLLCCTLVLCVASSDSELGRFQYRLPEIIDVGDRQVEVDESLERNPLEEEHFGLDESGQATYQGESLRGIDLSSHQGEVRWEEVAASGVEFAILRVGYRGYGQEGKLSEDGQFAANLAGAKAQGLMAGVYFFSQAITVEEAREEARFALSLLNGAELELPVFYDWEPVTSDTARTDGLDAETVTACAAAFCQVIGAGGYQPALYCNGELGYFSYDLGALKDYPLWYAEYGEAPTFAYRFDFWQYSNTGSVPGIDHPVDLNLYFPREEGER